MPARSLSRALVAATTVTAAAGLALGAATAAAAAPAHYARTPVFHSYDTGKHYKLTYSKRVQSGYLKLIATNTKGAGSGVQVVSFSKGLDFKHYVADEQRIGAEFQKDRKKASADFKAVLAKVHYWGGVGTQGKSSNSATLSLPAGHYVIWDDAGDVPAHAHAFTVVGPRAHRATPKYSTIVSMVKTDRFGGNTVLPAKGTIRVENKSHDPHFLFLTRVKTGTTHKQVADFLASGAQGEPSFVLPGTAESDTLNPGVNQFLTYSLPKGEYVELCFFPDDETGMPHALMGMFRIVTLK